MSSSPSPSNTPTTTPSLSQTSSRSIFGFSQQTSPSPNNITPTSSKSPSPFLNLTPSASSIFNPSQSNNTSINTENINTIFSDIYPNPASDKAFVNISFQSNAILSISVVDYLGKIIVNDKIKISMGNQKVQLPLPKLNSGIYFCKLTIEKHTVIKKIVIN